MIRRPGGAVAQALGSWLDRVADRGGQVTEVLLAVLCMAVAVVLCVQAVCRYVFNASLPWPDELAQVLLVWLTFLGGAAAWRRGTHLGLAAATGWLTARFGGGALVRWIPHLAGLCFFAVLFYHGLVLCEMLLPQRFPALGVTKVVSYAAIPASAALMAVHSLAVLLGGPASRQMMPGPMLGSKSGSMAGPTTGRGGA